MQSNQPSRFVILVALLIAFTAIVGYFVGLQSPMNPFEKTVRVQSFSRAIQSKRSQQEAETGSIPATAYSQMAKAVRANATLSNHSRMDGIFSTVDGLNGHPQSSELSVPQFSIAEQDAPPLGEDNSSSIATNSIATNSSAEISIAEKRFALSMRQKNRAFNGAPPTIPHPITELSAESCVACHLNGSFSTTLRIPKMSHTLLSNCTQCHVGTASPDMPNAMAIANHFVGLPAPESGPRAFLGAPPQIPHATFMRTDCLSCHGDTSYRGLRTTHPWRQNCQQCHTPSSALEQTELVSSPQFIEPVRPDSL